MTHLLLLLSRIPTQAFLAVTLGPIWCAGMVAVRVLMRRVSDGWH